jgi:CheY-like chemotaxis protein
MASLVYLDDELHLTKIFELWLADSEHSVRTFTVEAEAIEYCQQSNPDIFFVDFQLEQMRGDEVAAKIADDIKKVLVTGDIRVSSDYPFDAMLSKPVKLAELQGIIAKLLSQHDSKEK